MQDQLDKGCFARNVSHSHEGLQYSQSSFCTTQRSLSKQPASYRREIPRVKAYQEQVSAKENRVRKLQMLEERSRKRIEKLREQNQLKMNVKLRSLEEKQLLEHAKAAQAQEVEQQRRLIKERSQLARNNIEYGRLALQLRNKSLARAVRNHKETDRHVIYSSKRNRSVVVPIARAQHFQGLREKEAFAQKEKIREQRVRAVSEMKERIDLLDEIEHSLLERIQRAEREQDKEVTMTQRFLESAKEYNALYFPPRTFK